MILRTFAYRLLGQQAMQRMSERFWTRSVDTYAAPAAYYDARERILDEFLGSLPPVSAALDQGCGDGRFTAVVAKHAAHVDAYDISPALIASAKLRRLDNVAFDVGEVGTMPAGKQYDLVTCMGVTSCIVDDEKYANAVDSLTGSLREDGHLLLIDTVALGKTVTKAQKHGYIGKYRNATQYMDQVMSRGLMLVDNRVLIDWSSKLSNCMYLFQRK